MSPNIRGPSLVEAIPQEEVGEKPAPPLENKLLEKAGNPIKTDLPKQHPSNWFIQNGWMPDSCGYLPLNSGVGTAVISPISSWAGWEDADCSMWGPLEDIRVY